ETERLPLAPLPKANSRVSPGPRNHHQAWKRLSGVLVALPGRRLAVAEPVPVMPEGTTPFWNVPMPELAPPGVMVNCADAALASPVRAANATRTERPFMSTSPLLRLRRPASPRHGAAGERPEMDAGWTGASWPIPERRRRSGGARRQS